MYLPKQMAEKKKQIKKINSKSFLWQIVTVKILLMQFFIQIKTDDNTE